ncbi:MAG: type II toxin-antitoxin system MqsA family antitoxin [Nitrospira sp.]
MKCRTCGMEEMVELKATEDAPYHYTLSGLQEVYLVGISIWRCSSCGEEVPVIPKVGELHEAIARSLITRDGNLTGKEIKFLRKNAGFQSAEFAALMGVSATYMSKVENNRLKLGPGADKLVRILSSADEKLRDLLYEIAKDLKPTKKKGKPSTAKPVFRLERKRWLKAVA